MAGGAPLRTACAAVLGATAVLGAQVSVHQIPKGENVLLGRVVEMTTGSPVGGAIVTLIGGFDASGKPSSTYPTGLFLPTSTAPKNVLTTSDGYFVIRDLPAGRYAVAAAAFGYARNDHPPQLLDLRDSDKPTSMVMRLWKFGAISGTVTDERGEPVVGIRVSALRRGIIGGALTLRREVEDVLTDDRGVYRIGQLPAGTYVVGALWSPVSMPVSVLAIAEAPSANPSAVSALGIDLLRGGIRMPVSPTEGLRRGAFVLQQTGSPAAVAPDGRLLAYGNTLHPGTASVPDATAITLGSGESREGVDLPLRFVPTTSISGIVSGPDGPIRHLVLKLLPPNGADISDLESSGVPLAVTGADGAFAFLGVPPGAYVLKAALWIDDASAPEQGYGNTLWATQALTVGDTGITGITVLMKPGIRVSGRALFKGAENPIPAPGQRIPVTLRPPGAGSWRTLQALVRTDGTFATPGDPAGRYILSPNAPQGWTFHAMLRNGRPVPDEVIELEMADVTDIELVYSRKPTTILGSIVDAAGAPDPAADAVIFPADTTLWREGIVNSRRVRSAHATSAGTFEFLGLPPGDYYLAAVSLHLMVEWQDPAFLERLIRVATKVTVADGDEKTVSLKTLSAKEP
jgi:hypothetical protein